MGLIRKEIVQSRVWADPKAPEPPKLNYIDTYPITVYEAVKESMDDDAGNLKDLLDHIISELANKQQIFSGKPAEYLMTFAGTPGAVGSIITTREIPWDPTKQRHDRIPTEKAVGDLLFKLGLVDKNGNIDPNGGTKVDWQNIVGRPNTYDALGQNVDGFMTQKSVTDAINTVDGKVNELTTNTNTTFDKLTSRVDKHVSDVNNPHHVTIDQIGAISKELFQSHIEDVNNPHKVTKSQIGLSDVDNTSDVNKPISKAAQSAFDDVNTSIKNINEEMESFITDIKYDQPTGILAITFKNGSKVNILIPIDGLLDEIKYDKDNRQLLAIELGGHINKIDVSDLYVRYNGAASSNIDVTISDDTKDPCIHFINASIIPKSITDAEMADNSIITRTIKDQNVTTDKIEDLAVTTDKLANANVTNEKIAPLTILSTNISDRAITARTLFSSSVDNRILAVLKNDTDPVWTKVISDMIDDKAVKTINLDDKSVTDDKLGDKSVTVDKLDDSSVTTDKLAKSAVTNDKISDGTINGIKLITDALLPGTPRIDVRPTALSNNNQITDTFWVNNKIDTAKMRNDNILSRAIDGRTLFTSATANKVLAVVGQNTDPLWSAVTNQMMDTDSVSTNNIIDFNVTSNKIATKSIISRTVAPSAILSDHISESAVISEKIWKSDKANRLLASLNDNGHPVYTQLNRGMMPDAIVGTAQIEDRSVTMGKLETSNRNNRLLGVVGNGTDPLWMQANNGMLGDKSVDGRVLFSSPVKNRILAVTEIEGIPAWLQVTGDMIKDATIVKNNIAPGAIIADHMADKSITGNAIADHAVDTVNIVPRAITGDEIFTSNVPNRVLAVVDAPYTSAKWMQITTDMVEDKAITREKIFQSEYDYRVLGVTRAGVPPEYLRITSDFIVDDSIIPQKLVHNFVLFGVPESTEHPPADADNRQIPDTYWVRRVVASMIKDFNPRILFDTVSPEMIQKRCIDGTKLFTSDKGPRVLGITRPLADPEYILIEENLIVDGAVTSKKIQKDVTLYGSPTIQYRPFIDASDDKGGGNLIPDCQWVLNAIQMHKNGTLKFDPEFFIETEYGLSLNLANILTSKTEIDKLFTDPNSGTGIGGGPGGTAPGGGIGLSEDSVATEYIVNRAVTGDKLFSSTVANRLLGVLSPNSSPEYLQAVNEMISDRAVNGRTLFTSGSANKILGVTTPGSDPTWMLINNDMIDKNSVDTVNLLDDSVINSKVANRAIDGRTLFSSVTENRVLGVTTTGSDPTWLQIVSDMISPASVGKIHMKNDSIDTVQLCDHSVTQVKLEEGPIIDNIRLIDKSVTTNKLGDQAVENVNIKDGTIKAEKLVGDIQLPGHPTVAPDTEKTYQTRALRNTIISPDAPTGGQNGDIWLRYY